MNRALAAVSLITFICLCACADTSPKDAAAPGEAHEFFENNTLIIPLEPVTELQLWLRPQSIDVNSDGTFEHPEKTFVLASGLDYPKELLLTIAVEVCPREGFFDELEISQTGTAFELTEDGRLRIDTSDVGEHTAILRGTYRIPETASADCSYEQFSRDGVIRFSRPVTADVRAVTGIAINTCVEASPFGVLAGRGIARGAIYGQVFPTDDSGSPFRPENARSPMAVTVSIIGDIDSLDTSWLDETPALREVRFPAKSSSYTVRGEVGPGVEIHVVEPRQLTDVDLHMQIYQGTNDPIRVGDGERYGVDVMERSVDRIWTSTPMPIFAGDIPVCSALWRELVELHSTTPDTCEVVLRDHYGRSTYADPYLGSAAKLLKDGSCSLRISAPTLNYGEGIETSLTAEFVGVSETDALP